MGEATTQLEDLVLEESGAEVDGCPILVHPRQIERESENRTEREAYLRARQDLDRAEAEASVEVCEAEQPSEVGVFICPHISL